MRVKVVIMSLALHYWMGDVHHCLGPPVSEMTYTVSSGTLNFTIPYHHGIHVSVRRWNYLQVLEFTSGILQRWRSLWIFWLVFLKFGEHNKMCRHSNMKVWTVSPSLSREWKKLDTRFLPITAANVDRFSKFFHLWTQRWLSNELVIKDSTTP